MSLDNPIFLTAFFGIFHVIGGLAFGKGIRDVFANSTGRQLLIFGGIMGATPLIFDWFFLYREGWVVHAWIGPALFILASAIGAFVFTLPLTKTHEKSIGAILMGSIALMIGLMLTPFLINRALTLDLGPEDYIFGSCLLIMPLLVGFGFVWNGVTAILKNRAFDEHIAEREAEIEAKSSRKKSKKKETPS